MSRKIQFHAFHVLFRLFSYLADKSGGWSLFVRPKLLIGALIVGQGLTTCNTQSTDKPIQKEEKKKGDLKRSQIIPIDSTENTMLIACYDATELYTVTSDSNGVYTNVEQMPEFPSGNEAMFKYINNKIAYPKEAIKDNVEGIVICTFVVGKDGSISDIKVVRGVQPLLDVEAVRIVKSFPKWNPGRQGGKAVPVKFTLPVRFKLPAK